MNLLYKDEIKTLVEARDYLVHFGFYRLVQYHLEYFGLFLSLKNTLY